ncbi:ankyrin repeat-containing domain protein, partial [Halenospora varia]
MFLWVDLQLNVLQKCKRDKDIKDELRTLPQGLNKTYQRIVDQIGQLDQRLQDLARSTLTWVFYARRPLSIKELVEATAIDKTCLTQQDIDSNKYPEEVIFTACANLLTQESSVVRPIHYSVREYFTKTLNYNSSKVVGSLVNRNLAYAYLADCCIQYLMLESLTGGPCTRDYKLYERAGAHLLAAHSAYNFDHYIVRLDSVPPDLKRSLNRLLLSNKRSLASILQLRNLRDKSDWSNVHGTFTYLEEVLPEDMIYATALYNSRQLLSTSDRWKNIQPPRYALHLAAKAGSLNAIKPLIEAGKGVTEGDAHGLTPLYYASEGGYAVVCGLLVESGGDVNAQGGSYGNALQAASFGGHQAVVELLLTKGADANTQGGSYGNALQAASFGGHQAMVELLLTKGADVNAQGGHYGN